MMSAEVGVVNEVRWGVHNWEKTSLYIVVGSGCGGCDISSTLLQHFRAG